MRRPKQLTNTDLAELVETHNIALSLKRLSAGPYDLGRWRRALYHAVCMQGIGNPAMRTKMREALELP